MNVEFLKSADEDLRKIRQKEIEAERAAKEARKLELSEREHSVNFLDLIKKCYKDQYGYYFISRGCGFYSGPEIFPGNCKKIIVISDKDITENSFSISLVFDIAMDDPKVLIGRNLNSSFIRIPLSVWEEKTVNTYRSDMPYLFTTEYRDEEDFHPLYISSPADENYRPLTKNEIGSFKLIYPSIERIVNGFRKIRELVNNIVDPYIKLNEEFLLEKRRYFKEDYDYAEFKYMVNFLENFQPHVHKMFTTCFEKYDSGKKGFYHYLFIGIIGYNNIKLINPIKNFTEYDYPVVGENEQFVNLMSTVYTNNSGLGLGVGTGGYRNVGVKFYKDFDDFCDTELNDLSTSKICLDSVFDNLSHQVELSAFEDIEFHEVNPTLRYIISKL